MKERLNKFIHSRLFIIALVMILMGTTLLAGTYAWFTWSSTDNTKLVMSIGKMADVIFASGNDINGNLNPVYNYNDGLSTRFSINNRDTSGTPLGYNIYFNITTIDNELISEDVKWAIEKNGKLVNEGNLSEASNGSSITIGSGVITSGVTTHVFYLYIDGNVENDPTMMGKTITGNIIVESTEGENLVNYITSLYNNAEKTTVTNNSITYNYAKIYDTDTDDTTSGGLMNDRLGGTTTDYDAGNIRYYGASPNNYVDIGDAYEEETVIDNYQKNSLFLSMFGILDRNSCEVFFDCSTNYEAIGQIMGLEFIDEASCTLGLQNYYHISNLHEMCGTTTKAAGDPKLYRVIGLFKDVEMADGTTQDLIKVIREDSIGNLAWDLTGTSEDDAAFDNNWHDSTLQTMLNGAYYNSTATTHSYFDVVSQAVVFGSTIDFEKKGLNSAVHDKIATVKWNLGGWNSDNIYSNEAYGNERGDEKCTDCTYETTWLGKVALMYSSDYGYATDFSSCSNPLVNYSGDVDCYAKDWLFSLSNGNANEWLLTPYSGTAAHARYVSGGNVYGSFDVLGGVGGRPVFYLTSELVIVTGSGTETNPFVVR